MATYLLLDITNESPPVEIEFLTLFPQVNKQVLFIALAFIWPLVLLVGIITISWRKE